MNKPPCGIYCRVSSDEQVGNFSLPSQQTACEKLAREKGFSVSAEFTFIDAGYSGSEWDRPQLERLRKAAEAGLIRGVVCFDVDRLSRRLAHQALISELLEKADVGLFFVNGDHHGSTPEGKMFVQLKSVFAEFEKTKLIERTSRGQRQRALSGKATIPGYGYVMDADGKLVIDDERATIVRRIFDLTVAGQSASTIATTLNLDGVRGPTGGKWTRGSISGLLRRPVYIGQAHFGKSRKCEPKQRRKPAPLGKDKATSSRAMPRDQWVTIPCPSILDRGVWDRAQAKIDQIRIGRSGRPSLSYLLRGLLRCKCGAALTGCESHQRHYYRCCGHNGFEKRRYCGQVGLRVEAVEPVIWRSVVDVLTDPAKLAALYNSHHAELTEKARDNEAERRALEAQIAKLAKREFRAEQAMLDSDLSDSYSRFRSDLKSTLAEKRQLQARFDALQPAAASVSKTDFDTLSDDMREASSTTDRERQRRFLQGVLSEIRVDGADLHIVFAVNFEAVLGTLGGTPNDPDDGMGRNCITRQRRKIPRPCHRRRKTRVCRQLRKVHRGSHPRGKIPILPKRDPARTALGVDRPRRRVRGEFCHRSVSPRGRTEPGYRHRTKVRRNHGPRSVAATAALDGREGPDRP